MNVPHSGLPPEIVRLHAFLNSIDLRSFTRRGRQHSGGERLSTPRQLTDWLQEQGLAGSEISADERDIRRAHELRSQLRTCLERPSPADPRRAEPVSDALVSGVRLSFQLTFVPGRPPALASAQQEVDGALGRLVLCVADAVAAGTWDRLKMCEAPDCRWVFYDRSRPNRGRWCAAELCGNRMKTRAYRERRQ